MATQPKTMSVIGWILTLLVAGMLVMSATFKLRPPQEVQDGWVKSGFPAETLAPIGITELACVVLFLIPPTSVLGAILIVGYLGGAVCVHVRQSEPFAMPIIMGVATWLGLYFRDARLRALVPLRSSSAAPAKPPSGSP